MSENMPLIAMLTLTLTLIVTPQTVAYVIVPRTKQNVPPFHYNAPYYCSSGKSQTNPYKKMTHCWFLPLALHPCHTESKSSVWHIQAELLAQTIH